MARSLDVILVVDLESTCWEGEPPPSQTSEIIEIGLCTVDLKTLTRIEKRSFLVKPVQSEISDFCTELTTLTPGMFADAGNLAEAVKALKKAYRSKDRLKPNFLWMMYRSDWGRSDLQEVVLAIRLRRTFFDSLLEQAVFSSFGASGLSDHDQWKAAVNASDVRLQWDPDHLPTGGKCERRAVQLGLRGETLEAFGKRESVEIIDVSDFVAEQREHISNWKSGTLVTPTERVYDPADSSVAEHVGLNVQS